MEKSSEKKKIRFSGKYKDMWQEIIAEIKNTNPGLPGFLNKLEPAGEGDVFMLIATNEEGANSINFVSNDRFKEIILSSVEKVCGTRPKKLEFEQNVTAEQTGKLIEKIKNFDFVEIYE